MYSLKKAFPAGTCRIAFVDLFVRDNVSKGTKISLEMPACYLRVFEQYRHPRSRLAFIQILNRCTHLIYLLLNNLLVRIGQGKDPDRDTDLFQSQDLVQDKGL